jgi:hypothetical protein
MKKFEPPALHSAIIIGDEPMLIAQLSALFAQNGKYLSVIDGPRMARIDADAEIVRRNNAVVRSGASQIILAKIQKDVSTKLCGLFPSHVTFNINEVDASIHKVLGLIRRTGTTFRWSKSNIGIGLLYALQARKPIEFVDDPTDEMTGRYVPPKNGYLVVCEEGNELSQVIAANYAYSIGAGLFLIKAVGKAAAEALCEEFYGAYDNRKESMSAILSRLSEHLKLLAGDVPLDGVRGITFISKEIPWGFAFRELPTSHLFSYPDLGISIINGVAAEQKNSKRMRVAAVVDPAKIPSTEVEKMAEALAERGVFVRGFRGATATVNKILRMLELLPYDLLLIATHCGDASGWRETYRFVDAEGIRRELVMDTAIAVSSVPGREQLEVIAFERFVSLDGVDWNDKIALKQIIGNSVNDFFKVPLGDRQPDEQVEISRVTGSAALQMYDGNILLNPSGVGDNLTPVIMNNACASWHQLAGRFMFGNARAYIGTLIPVVGVEAEEIAEQVLKKHFGKPLALALWHAQNEVYKSGIRRPYIMVGVHYQRLSSTFELPHSYLLKRVSKSLAYWQDVLEKTPVGETKKRMAVTDNIEFLREEVAGLKQAFVR